MPDINLTLGSDTKEFKKGVKESRKSAFRLARDIRKLNERERAAKRRGDESSRKTQLRLDKRLSRKRAKNRLKAIKENVRAEKRAIRQIERAQKASNRRRSRLFKAGLGGAAAIGLGIGAVGLVQGRKILDFKKDVALFSTQVNISREAQDGLAESLTNTAIRLGVSRGSILDVFEQIGEKSGNFELAAQNIDQIGEILVGTTTTADDLGAALAGMEQAFKGKGIKNSELFDFLEILEAQADKGAIGIGNIASEAEKLFGAFKTAGFGNKKQFTEFGALLQIAGGGGGKAEAATFVTQFLDQLRKRSDIIQKATGVKVTKKGGILRDLGELIPELLQATGGDLGKISKLIPSVRGAKPLQLLGAAFQETKKSGAADPFAQYIALGQGAGGSRRRKAERVSETSAVKFQRLGALGTKLSEKSFEPVIDDLAKSIEKLLENPAALKQLEDTFRAFGDLLIIAAKVGGAGVRGAGFVAQSGRGSVIRSEFASRKKQLKTLPKSLQEQIREGNQGSLGFFSEPTLKQQEKFISDFDRLNMNLVVNIANDGTTDAKFSTDLGSKTLEVNRKR